MTDTTTDLLHLNALPSDWQTLCGLDSITAVDGYSVADDRSLATCPACIAADSENPR